jgi:hypothetical protein
MSFAASILKMPLLQGKWFKMGKEVFVWASSLFCIAYGSYIILQFI